MSVRTMLAAAASQIGYVETPVNDTKYGVWFGWNKVPWCDEFMSWCGAQAGEASAVGKFAGTRAHYAWFAKQGRIVATPRPGDLVFYAWSGGGVGGIDHIGVVERVLPGGSLQTIEGNTSTGQSLVARRNGGGVLRMVRNRGYVAGFARPAYKPDQQASRVPAALKVPAWYHRTLQLGSHGPDVSAMQRRFNAYGGRLVADGAFGPKTQAIVQRTQHNHHLPVDGVVGPRTAAVIG